MLISTRPVAALTFAIVTALSMTTAAAGQTVTGTGTITGTVSDETSGILPGVTVEISSPSLIGGTRSEVSDAEGRYRFVAVPPGDYAVKFELPGFSATVYEEIRVGLGFTATVNAKMRVSTLEETVTVRGDSPVVDAQSTQVRNTYEAEQMAHLPSARDYAALMASTPAVQASRVDVGGSASLSENSYRTYGILGTQDRPLVEGMLGSENTSLLFYTDYGSFEEVAINTAGNNAEMPGNGVYSAFIAKSGGNRYSGNVYIDYYNEDFSAVNIDEDLKNRGVTGSDTLRAEDTNRTKMYRDFNADLGGYILRDKIWWYGSYRYSVNQVARPNFPVRPQHTEVTNRTGKLTYNLNTNNKIIAFLNHNSKKQPDRINADQIYLDADSTWNQTGFPVGVWKVEYNSTLSPSLFFEARAGSYFYNWINEGKTDQLRYEDLVTRVVSGSERDFYNERKRHQAFATLSWFKNAAGSHNVRTGVEVMDEWLDAFEGGRPGNVVHGTRDGAPAEVTLWETPNHSLSGLRTYAAFIQDTWQVNKRLTVTPGLRFDRFRDYLQEQDHTDPFTGRVTPFPAVDNVYDTNNWGPRLGMTYDLTGRGRSVIKANWGLFRHSPGVSLFRPNPPIWSKRYAWSDPNSNGRFDAGEEGLLLATAGGLFSTSVDPDLEMAKTHELAVLLEHQLGDQFGIRTGMVWKRLDDNIQNRNINQPFEAFSVPMTVQDPGPDGVAGNADDGAPLQAFNLEPAYLGRPTVTLVSYNDDFQSDYYTWEVTARKRMTNRWSLLASFAHTWLREHANALNPNEVINTEDGRRHNVQWQGKLNGTIELPAEFTLSPLFRFEKGRAIARTAVVRLNYGNQTIQAEPFGERYTANLYLMDLRLERPITFANTRLVPFLDLFNITNTNAEETVIVTSGSSFLRPTRIVPPFVARIGLRYTF
jgi:Carboxypeptidase regulatory-like domain/TonB dependent receptor